MISNRANGHKAIALVLVIVVLATLAAIATPFVVSMLYKEKITKHTFYQTQTRFSALSARNHAIPLLLRGHSFYERQAESIAPFNTPDYDTLEEFKIDFEADELSSHLEVANPRGYIRGCVIEDLQGKINVKTAPAALISNLRDVILPERTRDEIDFATAYFYRSPIWVRPVWLYGYEKVVLPKSEKAALSAREVHRLYINPATPAHYYTDRARVRVSYGDKECLAHVEEVKKTVRIIERKIWTRSTPRRSVILDRLIPEELLTSKTLLEEEQIDITDYVTEHSYRSSNWIAPVQLRGYERVVLLGGKRVHRFFVDQSIASHYFTDRPRIRVSRDQAAFLAYVEFTPVVKIEEIKIWYPYADRKRIMLDRLVPEELLTPESLVEVEQRHSININTAPREVLIANVFNIGQRRVNKETGEVNYDDRITKKQACQVADLIIQLRNDPQGYPVAPADKPHRFFREPSDYLSFIRYLNNHEVITSSRCTNLLFDGTRETGYYYDAFKGEITQTLPFCFRSSDAYSLTSTSILNYPSGLEATRTSFREIVDLEPPGVVSWRLTSQYDFDRVFETPYATKDKLITYPFLTTLQWPAKSYIMPQTPSQPAHQIEGYVKLRAVEDKRGRGIKKSEHFSNTHEGRVLQGAPLTYSSKEIFTFRGSLDIQPGGVEMWVKFYALPQDDSEVYLYDIRQDDYENRISLYYTGSELVLVVADATKARQASQIRAETVFMPNMWYHVGAYWKGTKYAQLALFVDGFPAGSFDHYDEGDSKISTELSADLAEEELVVSVESIAGFPKQGAIEIGDEVIEYDKIIGSSFQVKQIFDQTGRLVWSGRGARVREPLPKNHPAGARVSIYGYANFLKQQITLPGRYPTINLDRLTTGGGKLQQDIPSHYVRTTIFKPEVSIRDPDTGQWIIIQESGITVEDTQIPVPLDTNLAEEGFPDEGYLKIGSEVIFYNGIGTMSVLDQEGNEIEVPCFINCRRGDLGTTSTVHGHRARIDLYSIKLTSNVNYLDPALIQIGDEWFGPVQKVDTNYFTGVVKSKRPLWLLRGFAGTGLAGHTAGADVIPVFAMNEPYCGDNLLAEEEGDVVTVVEKDQTKSKDERTINLTRTFVYVENNTTITQYLVAFTENVSRDYPIDGRVTRLLKFPSDELPSYLPGRLSVGEYVGLIDEIRFFQSGKVDFKLSAILKEEGNEKKIPMNRSPGRTCGMIKVGDELIGYAGQGASQLLHAQRGYLGTPRPALASGTRVFHLSSMIPISALAEGISHRDSEIPLKTRDGFMKEGHLLIDDEVIGYCWSRGNRVAMPETDETEPLTGGPEMDKSMGLYRGAFGTLPAPHKEHALVYAIPFRYYDRYQTESFDTTMVYYRAAHQITDGLFHQIKWREEKRMYKDVRLKALVRLDHKPTWDTVPTNQPGGIFEFTSPPLGQVSGPPGPEREAVGVINQKADQIEIMFVFEYLNGAFKSGAWKYSPELRGITVEYERNPTALIKYRLLLR